MKKQKKRLLSLYLAEIIKSPLLYISAGIILAVLSLEGFIIVPKGGTLYDVVRAMSYDFTTKVTYIAACLPFILSVCDDCTNQYIRAIVVRSGVRKYSSSKFCAGVISAFAALFLGMFSFAVISSFKTLLYDPRIEIQSSYAFGFFDTIGLYWIPVIFACIIFAAYGAMYACFGMLIAAAVPNKFAAAITPILLAFFVDEMCWYFAIPQGLNFTELATGTILFNGESLAGAALNFIYPIFVTLVIEFGVYIIFDKLIELRVNCEINN